MRYVDCTRTVNKLDAIGLCSDSVHKNAICSASWAWASVILGAADGSLPMLNWEVMSWDPNGRIHKSVVGSFAPRKIILPLYSTIHSFLVNVTSLRLPLVPVFQTVKQWTGPV